MKHRQALPTQDKNSTPQAPRPRLFLVRPAGGAGGRWEDLLRAGFPVSREHFRPGPENSYLRPWSLQRSGLRN